MKRDRKEVRVMDKKSFIRGFGTGVLFATLILGISCLIRTSDSAVIRRAKALGMGYVVEDDSLFSSDKASTKGAVSADGQKETKDSSKAKKTNKPTQTPESTETVKKKEDISDQKDTLDKEKEKMEKEFQDAGKEFTIRAGEWSSEVSRRLEEMNLISDAEEFDAYLEKNGYSDEIRAGTFEISSGADFDEIARTITSR